MSIIRQPFRYSNFNVVYWLIGINILVFIAMQFLGHIVVSELDVSELGITYQNRPVDKFSLPLKDVLAMMPYEVIKNKAIWTFVTYLFMHGGITHILFNMLGLFIFGIQVERQMGSKEFLLYYLVTGALAGVFSFLVYYFTGNYFVSLVGASGAIFAVQLAYAVFFPTSIIYIWGIIPLRAPVMVLGFTALELFFSIRGGGNVAHLTHLAGFAFGWIYFLIRSGINPWRRLTGR